MELEPTLNLAQEQNRFPRIKEAAAIFLASTALLGGGNAAAEAQPTRDTGVEQRAMNENITPLEIKNDIRGAMINAREDENSGFATTIRRIPIKKAMFAQRGDIAQVVGPKKGLPLREYSALDQATRGRNIVKVYNPPHGYATQGGGGQEKIDYKATIDQIAEDVISATGKNPQNFGPAVKTIATKKNGWNKAVTFFARSKDVSKPIRKVIQNKSGEVTDITHYKN